MYDDIYILNVFILYLYKCFFFYFQNHISIIPIMIQIVNATPGKY